MSFVWKALKAAFREFAASFSSSSPDLTSLPTVDRDFYDALVAFMEREKPYLRPSLRLVDLSDQMDVPARRVSNVINAHFQSNFRDFVNVFRVREAERRLESGDSDSLTLASIATDVGFTSRATFNRAFKRATGLTPSRYAERVRNGDTGDT